jgi:hypothetical protein
VRVALGLVALSVLACSEPSTGTLHVRVVDAAVGEEVPARLELRDERGNTWVAEDAVPLRFECILQPLSDGVSAEHLRRNRPALVAAIAEARERYRALLDGAAR